MPLPAVLEKQLQELPEEKRECLLSEDADSFVGTRRKLIKRLEGKTAAEIEAFVDGMIAVAEASLFDPDRDMAVIPLNTESEEFNSWKVMRPKSLNPSREPGPFRLSYYAGFQGYFGIRTFAGAPS